MKENAHIRIAPEKLEAIRKSFLTNKYSVRELKRLYQCSQRTVYKAIQDVDNSGDKRS